MYDTKKYPVELQHILAGFKVIRVIDGRVGDKIIKFVSTENEVVFLKISSTEFSRVEIFSEYKMLNWLVGTKLSVPRIKYYKECGDISYMLISEVEGTSSHLIDNKLGKEDAIKIAAEGLKEIHKVDFSLGLSNGEDCLDIELRNICKDVDDDMIDVEAFKKANLDKTPESALKYLLSKRDIFNSDVFTHGDYCLPNILIAENKKVGFVDWAQAGRADIYRDISPIIKSIDRNFGQSYSKLFFKYYGIKDKDVDYEKIEYYNLLDQFAYCKKNLFV